MSTRWEATGKERREEERRVGCFRLNLRHPTGDKRKVWTIYVESTLIFSGTSKTRHEAKDRCESKLEEILDKIAEDF